MSYLKLLLPLFFCLNLWADPWGKDADMANKKFLSKPISLPCKAKNSVLVSAANQAILFHQHFISPADGPRSHFIPSSSQYTKEAIIKYGFIKGVVLGCDRLMRENNDPWVYPTVIDAAGYKMKLNPVP